MTLKGISGAAFAALSLAGPALAADLPSRKEVYVEPAPMLAAPPSWAGLYVGLSAGGGWGRQAQQGGFLMPATAAAPAPPPIIFIKPDGNYGISGAIAGGGIGYNLQFDRFVVGLEGDASWSNISGAGICGAPLSFPHACGGGIRGLGTIRGRLGYDLGALGSIPVLAYATGGLALGGVHGWDSLLGGSGSAFQAGWTVGAGLEAMIAPNWGLKIEYLHVDLGSRNLFTAIPPFPERVSTRAEIVRVGVNYHFDLSAPEPVVVARY